MNNSLFNTTQETATRLTLCLPLLSRPSTIDEITAIDLIATYMKTFGFGQRNLITPEILRKLVEGLR